MVKEDEHLYNLGVNFLFNSISNLIELNYSQFKWNKSSDKAYLCMRNSLVRKPFILSKEIIIEINIKDRKLLICNINQGSKTIAYKEFKIPAEFTLEYSEDISTNIFVWIKEIMKQVV